MQKYILKVKNNNGIEEKEFFNEEEAVQELEVYKKDKGNSYAYIALIDVEKNTIIRILYFENGRLVSDLKDRAIVRIKKEYCEVNERKYLYLVSNINENNESCLIMCLNGGLPINTAESIKITMLENR